MGLAIKVYEAFKDDETKAKILADVIDQLEMMRKVNETNMKGDLQTTQLALTKEIEVIRGEIKETELRLVKEIEKVRAHLYIEIEKIRSDLIKEIHASHNSLLRWIIGLFVTGVVTQAGVIIGLFQMFGK